MAGHAAEISYIYIAREKKGGRERELKTVYLHLIGEGYYTDDGFQ